MAEAPLSPFAPPPTTPVAPAGGPPLREVVTFFLVRVFVLVVGPAMFGLVPALLGFSTPRAAAVGAAVGFGLWVPSSSVLFRLLFFPGPPDSGLLDAAGRPVAARDLRLGLFARAAEHVLGTAPLLLLVPYAWRAFEPAVAIGLSAVVLGWVGWRELHHAGKVLVEDAEILLHTGQVTEALARTGFATRWLPRTGDSGALVLARARFRTGDAPGAVEALERIRDRAAYHAELLRAQMGVAFLPRDQVEQARAAAAADPDTALVADILRALVLLHDGRQVPEDLLQRLSAEEHHGRGLPRLLAAAGRAANDPAAGRRLLAGWDRDEAELAAMAKAWPAVAQALDLLR